jgi:hypothetical protein
MVDELDQSKPKNPNVSNSKNINYIASYKHSKSVNFKFIFKFHHLIDTDAKAKTKYQYHAKKFD